jgi:hypothetical protein
MCLGVTVLGIGAFVATLLITVVPYDRSAYTQAHGLLRSGIVTSVANQSNSGADVGVRLTQSVAGHATTTAHVPAKVSLSPGAAVQVLVDPKDPGYAELPRQQFVLKSTTQLVVIIGLVLIAGFTFGTVMAGRAWRRQSRAR